MRLAGSRGTKHAREMIQGQPGIHYIFNDYDVPSGNTHVEILVDANYSGSFFLHCRNLKLRENQLAIIIELTNKIAEKMH